MKLQDVLLKAIAKEISWVIAAEIIGVTPRTMRRWQERLEEDGYDGLADRRKGKLTDEQLQQLDAFWSRPALSRFPLSVEKARRRLYEFVCQAPRCSNRRPGSGADVGRNGRAR